MASPCEGWLTRLEDPSDPRPTMQEGFCAVCRVRLMSLLQAVADSRAREDEVGERG